MVITETIEAHANASVEMTARQRLIAVLLLGTNFMLSVDFSILNIALPEVGGPSASNLPTFLGSPQLSRFRPPDCLSCLVGWATSTAGAACLLEASRFSRWPHLWLALRPGRFFSLGHGLSRGLPPR